LFEELRTVDNRWAWPRKASHLRIGQLLGEACVDLR